MSGTQEFIEFIISVDPSFDISSVNSINTAIHAFDDLFDQAPKQIAAKIDTLITFAERTANGTILCDGHDRYQLLDLVVGVVKKYPKLVKANKYRISQVYRLILNLVVITVSQPTDQWISPPNGFREDMGGGQVSENILISSICSCCDQISQTIDFDDVITYLQPLYLEFIQKPDNWRYTFSALMVASQIGVTDAEVEKIDTFVQWAFLAASHQHPKVRYAAMHLLGQLSEDLNPQFGNKYYEMFIPLTLKLIQDSAPRVVAHTYACISNYFDQCEQQWKVEKVIEHYLNPLVVSLNSYQSWVMENALSALNSFAMVENVFDKQLPGVILLTYQIIHNCSGKQQFKQTVCQCIQLLGSLLSHQKKEVVQFYLADYIKVLFEKRGEIEVTYFMLGWQKICLAYQNFTDLTYLYPILLESLKKMLDDFSDNDCINGFLSLEGTFNAFKTQAAPFVDDTMSFAKTTFENSGYITGLKEAGFKLMITAMKETKPSGGHEFRQWQNTVKNILTYLFENIDEAFQENEDFEDLSIIFKGIEDLASAFGTGFSNHQLISLTERMLCYSLRIEKSYNSVEYTNISFETDNDELGSNEQIELTDDRIQDLEVSLGKIPDVIEQILKIPTQAATRAEIIRKIHTQIVASMNKVEIMVEYGISLALAILQVVDYTEISSLWSQYLEVFAHFSTHKNPQIRNASVYGINLIVKKGPSDYFNKVQLQKMLQLLSKAYVQQFQDPSSKYFINNCKDNIVGALGSLIKGYTNNYPDVFNETVRSNWLSQLPLNVDIEEGNNQQDFLIDILTHSPSLVINQAKDLITILRNYANFVAKRSQKEYKEYVDKTKRSLQMMKEWAQFKANQEYIWSNLTSSQCNVLTHLMKKE